MKKLMIVAAVAAMSMCASAKTFVPGGNCGDDVCFSAYKVTVSLKTTAPKVTTKRDNCDECVTSCTYYRKQASLKVNGIIYGEADCESCDVSLPENMVLWTKNGPFVADLSLFIGQIDKTGKKVEAYGALEGDVGALQLAGFGAMSLRSTPDTECEDGFCTGYVKSLSGNIAGYLDPTYFYDVEDCDEVEIDCCGNGSLEYTAAYGTWKVSYNNSTAKKMGKAIAQGYEAEDGYKFPVQAFQDGEITINEVIIEE